MGYHLIIKYLYSRNEKSLTPGLFEKKSKNRNFEIPFNVFNIFERLGISLGDYTDATGRNIKPGRVEDLLKRIKKESLGVIPERYYEEYFDLSKFTHSSVAEESAPEHLNPYFERVRQELVELLERAIKLNASIRIGVD